MPTAVRTNRAGFVELARSYKQLNAPLRELSQRPSASPTGGSRPQGFRGWRREWLCAPASLRNSNPNTIGRTAMDRRHSSRAGERNVARLSRSAGVYRGKVALGRVTRPCYQRLPLLFPRLRLAVFFAPLFLLVRVFLETDLLPARPAFVSVRFLCLPAGFLLVVFLRAGDGITPTRSTTSPGLTSSTFFSALWRPFDMLSKTAPAAAGPAAASPAVAASFATATPVLAALTIVFLGLVQNAFLRHDIFPPPNVNAAHASEVPISE
jgi:hypothetical protein